MKKNINLILVSLNLLSLLVVFACKRNTGNGAGKGNDRILIKGSDTEYQLVKFMAGQYATTNESAFVHVMDGGSGVGISAFINGEIDIANSSRAMTAEEYRIAEKNGIRPIQIMFAIDAVSVITNSKLGIDSLSLRQVGQIFSGAVRNWKELGGPDAPIHLYGRDNTSGTYQYFKDKFVQGGDYASGMSHLRGNA